MDIDDKTRKKIIELMELNKVIFTKAAEDSKVGFKDKFLAKQQLKKIDSILEVLNG